MRLWGSSWGGRGGRARLCTTPCPESRLQRVGAAATLPDSADPVLDTQHPARGAEPGG